jgi:nicotinate-nucleotide pyrophosphorylase (carboxylating)
MPPAVLREAVAGRRAGADRSLGRGAARHHPRDCGDRGDYISVGRITQSAPAVDIGLDYELTP